MASSFLCPLHSQAEKPEMWLGFWRQCGHGHEQACGIGKDGHRVSGGVFRLARMASFLHFFNLDSWPWMRVVIIRADFLLRLDFRSELIPTTEMLPCCAATLSLSSISWQLAVVANPNKK